MLHTVERYIFACAKHEFESFCLSEDCTAALEQLVALYRDVLAEFCSTEDSEGRIQVELRSRETLVMWATFCMVHRTSREVYPLVDKYDVPLAWGDLKHLVLDGKLACDALLQVVAYLRLQTCQKPVLFSLSHESHTLGFAEEFAQGNNHMKAVWESEQHNAKVRKETHWAKVLEKKAHAMVL